MIKFSVIVPVYNVEKYLSNCIESILNQSYSNFELILVNDGSTDRSGQICNEYAKNDKRIVVLNKENGGLSDARNKGVTKATGEYIVFIDSDDYIEKYSLEIFNNALQISNLPDVLISRIRKVYQDSEYKYMDPNMPVEIIRQGRKKDIIDWIFKKSDHTWPSVRYIVKHNLILEYNLSFMVGYLHEDVDWTSKVFLYASTFTGVDYYWYNYRIGRQGSITASMNAKRTLDIIDIVWKRIIGKDENNKVDTYTRNTIYRRMVKSVIYSLKDYKYYSEDEKKEIVFNLRNKQEIFNYLSSFRHIVFILFCRLFGFYRGMQIYEKLQKE